MKYKVGDKVRVKRDLVADKTYGNENVYFRRGMTYYEGQVVTISEVGDYFYKIKEDFPYNWSWTDEMLEDIVENKNKYKVGDKVKVRNDLVDDEKYGGIDYVSNMDKWKGKVVTISYVNDAYYEIAEDEQYDKWSWSAEMFEDVTDDENKARTVDVGYYLKFCGHRVIENVYQSQGVDNGKLFFATVDGLNQYILQKDAIKWVVPHEG